MKIKFKFTLAISIILIAFSLILNILIRQVLVYNMENSISRSMEDIMKSSREYVKYRLMVNDKLSDDDILKNDASYISKYISLNYESNSKVMDMQGNILNNDDSNESMGGESKLIANAKKGEAVVKIKYIKDNVQGDMVFPVYINSRYLGIIYLNKSYSDILVTYKNTINTITIIQIIILVIILATSFLITAKITKPVSDLTNAVKKVGEGIYDINIRVNSKDEVGILSMEFINMKEKICNQINTIKNEKEKVEKLEKARRDFFNNVTHELKTPLTAISGYAELLLEGIVTDSDFKNRALERIYSESERLHSLVLELIDISKGISFIEEDVEDIDMKLLISEICDDMSIKAKKYSLEIEQKVSKGTIPGRINKIRELLINILDNAIKYSVGSSPILIKTYIKENFYIIEVVNKGELIPGEVYNNIFQPFTKGSDVREDSRGLGLYICSEIVRMHNGKISIENGEIITANIELPLSGNNLETSL
ncbi:histidine kinase [Clostridium manihotivorum]|uniref:histidine kinase n=2 Tax=Clostridium manihotivorum TaxID=2320868 RepID=A0A3R5TFB9_9CLOT|nr:histidine kinase [Clostridium manihotivorum]